MAQVCWGLWGGQLFWTASGSDGYGRELRCRSVCVCVISQPANENI